MLQSSDVRFTLRMWARHVEQLSGQRPPTYDVVGELLRSRRSFESFGLHQPTGVPVTLSGAGETLRVSQTPVEVNGLSVVGVRPILGRTYRLDDFKDVVKEKEARATVVSYDMWQRHFDGAADVIGRTIQRGCRASNRHRSHAARLRAHPWARHHRFLVSGRFPTHGG